MKKPPNLGFTTYELMIALGIASVFMVVFGTVMVSTSKMQSLGFSRSQIEVFRRELLQNINSNDSWTATLAGSLNATSMACIRDNSPCTTTGAPGGPGIADRAFAIYDRGGTLFYDGTQTRAGLTPQGNSCNAFSSTGSDECPYGVQLRWSAICAPPNCVNPLLKITATFSYQPKTPNATINAATYNLTVYRNSSSAAIVPPTPPTCTPLTHTANQRNFAVSWTGGANNGPGSCAIEYQRTDSTWRPVNSPNPVDCDIDGSALGPITLPADGWPGGAWASPIAVRLVRVSDGSVLCALGNLTCATMAASSVSTPNVDEDCDGLWDNNLNTSVYYGHSLGPLPLGGAYTCPDIPGHSFINVELVSNALTFTEHRFNQTCSGAATFTNPYLIHRIWPKSGTLPGPGPFVYGTMDPATHSPDLFDPSSTACQTNIHSMPSYQISAPLTQWDKVTCDYTTYSFSYR